MLKPQNCYIEISGICNAHCPYCVKGSGAQAQGQFMEVDAFEKLLGYLQRQNGFPEHKVLALYNWGEPFLHPHLNELLYIADSFGLKVNLSSNFLHLPNLTTKSFKIINGVTFSLSGFSQESYGRIHGGQLAKVLDNFDIFSAQVEANGCKWMPLVHWHRYRFNEREMSLAKNYFAQRRTNFVSSVAHFNDLQRTIDFFVNKNITGNEYVSITSDLFTDFMEDSFNKCAGSDFICPQWNTLVFNERCEHLLCCGWSDKVPGYVLGSLYDFDLATIYEIKKRSSLCKQCIQSGIARYGFNQFDFSLDEFKAKKLGNSQSNDSSVVQYGYNTFSLSGRDAQSSLHQTNLPLVSIGVPLYNEAKYLKQTLESLVAQDYPNIEIIISDNASSDNTGEICQKFVEHYSHIKYHRFDKNYGSITNFLYTAENSYGKYFMFAAGHDLWHPSFISKAVRIMENDDEIALCYARATRIDSCGNTLQLAKNTMDLRGMPAHKRLEHLVNNISGADPIYGLIRASYMHYLKAFSSNPVWGADQVLLARFTLLGTIAHIPEVLFFWREVANEDIEYRKKTVPLAIDTNKGQQMLNLSTPELWRQMGEATIQVINESSLSMPEKLECKTEVRQCFTRRYGVQWNEVIPYDLKADGKNILLTTSAAPDQTPFSTTEKRPPIGVGFLISVLRDAGHNVFFVDNYLSPSDFLETDYLQRHRIDFVGIYTNTICYRDSLRMFYRLEELRQKGLWQGKIIAGGPHASVVPETIPPFVDHIVIGEGEYALRDIVVGKVTERIVKYPSITDLDELPMPAWDYFAEMPYNWGGNWLPSAPVFTMNTSRGCPFDCTFCSVGSIWGRRYTYFSAERIVSDIEHVVNHYGAKGIYFREDNFTLNKKRLYEFCNLMIAKNLDIPWVCETRASSLDRETVELMARAGAKGAYIGVESGSQRLLEFMHKTIKLEDVRHAFQLCHTYNIKTAASIIVGVPTETEQERQMTMKLLDEIKPTVTWFNIFVGIPKSNLYQYVLDEKLYEYVDDRGLVYLKGHNKLVKEWYNNTWDAGLPIKLENNIIINPKISVIMSVYNGGKYLFNAVQSIQRQTYNNFEFIIIDDASTDNTTAILDSIDDPRVRIFRNQSNIGLTRSLNKALKHCRGEFIARMDADDFSVPHRFETQVTYLENNPSIALVGSAYYMTNDDDAIVATIGVLTDPDAIHNDLIRQNWFGHGSVMMRKSCLSSAGGYDEEFTYAQDYDLFLRLSETCKLANIAEPLYFWRKSQQGISQQKTQEQKYFAMLARKRAVLRRSATACHSSTPLVSVIIPTYNRPDMLVGAVKSVLAQTFTNFEIIVINDCGIDVSEIFTVIDDKRITYINHEVSKGPAATRNTGIRAARGKYIAYLDDDDIYYPDHLEILVSWLENNPEYKVAYTDAYRAHQEPDGVGGYVVVKKDVPYSFDFDYERIFHINFIPILCIVHAKECMEVVGMFDESLRSHEDWDLWMRMSQQFRFYHIAKLTSEFRRRTDYTSLSFSNHMQETYRIVKAKGQLIKK